MKKSRRKSRVLIKDLVQQRMQILYKLAVNEARKGNWDYASQLGTLIKEMGMSTRVRPPKYIRRSICKQCGLPLIPGLTASIRLKSQGRFSYIVIKCARCGWIHRRPYKKGVSRNAT